MLKFSAQLGNLSELELALAVKNPNVGLYLKITTHQFIPHVISMLFVMLYLFNYLYFCNLQMQCIVCKEVQTKMITVVPDVKWPEITRAPNNFMKVRNFLVQFLESSTFSFFELLIFGFSARLVLVVLQLPSPLLKGNSLTKEQSENGVLVPLMEISSSLFKPIDCIFSSGWQAETVRSLTHLHFLLFVLSTNDFVVCRLLVPSLMRLI